MQLQSLVQVNMIDANKSQMTKNMIGANIELEKSMLYMDDDQLKMHKAHAQKLENTRNELRNKVQEINKTKQGIEHYKEIRNIEDQYHNQVTIANNELAIKMKMGTGNEKGWFLKNQKEIYVHS